MKPNVAKIIEALQDILITCRDHPSFSEELFDARNIDELCKIGGDICDWTMLAIIADNALKDPPCPRRGWRGRGRQIN